MTTCQDIDITRVAWHVSTRSEGSHGNCVEAGPVADGTGRVAVRHSYHPGAHLLAYDCDAWTAFTASIKRGGFDLA